MVTHDYWQIPKELKDQCLSVLERKLSEQGMMLSEETLEFTAERYARRIMHDPDLTAAQLVDEDITRLKTIQETINNR